MKRTDNNSSALRKSVTKPKKAPLANAAQAGVSAVSKKTSKTAATAEKSLKIIKAKSPAKVSAPLPKVKKSASDKIAVPVKPIARKKNSVLTKPETAKNTKHVITGKTAVSAPKPKKAALSSGDKSKHKKAVQPVSQKTARLKKEQILPVNAVKKSKTSEKKAEVVVSAVKQKKIRAVAETKPTTATGNSKARTSAPKVSQKADVKKADVKKAEVIIPTKAQKLKTKPAAEKKAPLIPAVNNQKAKAKAEKAARKIEIIAPITPPKLKKKVETAEKKMPKPLAKKAETLGKKPAKKIEKKIEIVVPPIAAKPVKKKLKPIGSAVVRGKSGRYDFEVFPLDADLKDGSAIYVISKRITDPRGRGHHKFVCIGQTESLLGEIKRHKKDKCIKQHKANVICLLREESAANRLKIETDLREAHSIACNQK